MWLLLVAACSWSPTPPSGSRQGRVDTGADGEAEPAQGLWNRARDAKAPVSASEEIAQLEAIGYVGGSEPAGARSGVTVNRPEAWAGLNLALSGHGPEAVLFAMDGTELHRWSMPWKTAFPNGKREKNVHGVEFWRRAALLPDGSLLAIFEGHGLIKLDRASNLVWAWDGRPHHDLEVLDDGSMWVLARTGRVIERRHPTRPVLEDFAVHLSADGVELERISLLEAIEASPAVEVLNAQKKRFGDIFHTNSLEVLDGRAAARNPAFADGNLLVSMRTTSTLAVLDPRTRQIVWWHTGEYAKQHDPTVIDERSLMVFDNSGLGKRSAVRVFDVADMTETWRFEGTDAMPFYSRFCGAAQRLPNGDTLVVESGFGHVFELSPAGDVVWEYHNPNRAGENGQFVAIVPDLVRLPADAAPWLTGP